MFHEEFSLGFVYGFQMFPQSKGLFLPEYDGWMRAAIGVLHRSNIPGKHEAKLNLSSSHKEKSVHSDIFTESAIG